MIERAKSNLSFYQTADPFYPAYGLDVMCNAHFYMIQYL